MQRLALCAALLASGLAEASTLRCGSNLINEGDRAFEVEKKCGPPTHRDQVGYTLSGYDRREYSIEEWVYGPKNGMLNILTFEGNRLKRIETRRAN
ncbi:DUF2845 domain-containing protein [Aquipseudomonas ullengensis]|uniref:DUF2845 domain-containing protein n=1 Tax=Aquipseudomonas ullengensis TaxID=2759166 RepID=A0A7W4LI31_9GAMM|nr:DUF2845 domain-containing protein [Pseudomonas ullengensis]MBB2493462.1 DUF2845 domain-containing protein [Pseudomonas ullengensis]